MARRWIAAALVVVAACGDSASEVHTGAQSDVVGQADAGADTTTASAADSHSAADAADDAAPAGSADAPAGARDTAVAGDDAGDAAPAPGTIGSSCVDGQSCDSGWCVPAGTGPVCTRTCIDQCPTGWRCLPADSQSVDVSYVCLPDDGPGTVNDFIAPPAMPGDADGDGIPDEDDHVPCRAVQLQVWNVGVSSGEVVLNGEVMLGSGDFPTDQVLAVYLNVTLGTNTLSLGGKLTGSPGDLFVFRVVDTLGIVYLHEVATRGSGSPQEIVLTFEVDIQCD